MINIIFCGCNGRMGKVIRELVDESGSFNIVAGVDITPGTADFPIYETISECKEKADVVIDFSTPKVLDKILNYATLTSTPVVLCTTGYTPEQIAAIETASAKVAILRSGNMSLGINTMLKLISEAARILADNGFDMEIVERHHNKKLDAPSGTALMLAEALKKAAGADYDYVYDRTDRRELRPKNEIGISAVRAGSIVGEHEVIFGGLDEVIEIKHTAYSRAIFGKGALAAAKFLAGKSSGLYNMQDAI